VTQQLHAGISIGTSIDMYSHKKNDGEGGSDNVRNEEFMR
jgi:hypothetical protein